MRILIAAVGRFGGRRGGPERTLFDHYAERIIPPPALREVEEKRPLPAPQRRRREGELLLAQVPKGAVMVALDEGGRTLSSADFARRLAAWRDQAGRDLAFLIGGADGLDEAVTEGADLVLSLGPMTWPHLMVRGLLAEQIYRAQCINSGHPYHRE
jgi:23S rRNA (pseudouridine1915-N3)-methyltransferase